MYLLEKLCIYVWLKMPLSCGQSKQGQCHQIVLLFQQSSMIFSWHSHFGITKVSAGFAWCENWTELYSTSWLAVTFSDVRSKFQCGLWRYFWTNKLRGNMHKEECLSLEWGTAGVPRWNATIGPCQAAPEFRARGPNVTLLVFVSHCHRTFLFPLPLLHLLKASSPPRWKPVSLHPNINCKCVLSTRSLYIQFTNVSSRMVYAKQRNSLCSQTGAFAYSRFTNQIIHKCKHHLANLANLAAKEGVVSVLFQ